MKKLWLAVALLSVLLVLDLVISHIWSTDDETSDAPPKIATSEKAKSEKPKPVKGIIFKEEAAQKKKPLAKPAFGRSSRSCNGVVKSFLKLKVKDIKRQHIKNLLNFREQDEKHAVNIMKALDWYQTCKAIETEQMSYCQWADKVLKDKADCHMNFALLAPLVQHFILSADQKSYQKLMQAMPEEYLEFSSAIFEALIKNDSALCPDSEKTPEASYICKVATGKEKNAPTDASLRDVYWATKSIMLKDKNLINNIGKEVAPLKYINAALLGEKAQCEKMYTELLGKACAD